MRRRTDLIFPMFEYERRLKDVRRHMESRGVDALIVTMPENIFYLTGFHTTGYASFQTVIVPLEAGPIMVTRVLEDTGVQALSWIDVSRPYPDGYDPIKRTREVLEEFDLANKHIGYERDSFFLTAVQQEQLIASCPNATFVDCSGIVEEGRLVKSELEINLIRRAARAAEAGLRAGFETAAAGVTENEIAAEVHHAMYSAGGEYPAVSPFVASGPRSAIGHATWTGRTLEPGDCVFIEVGGAKSRYHAALMRSGFLGEPDAVTLSAERAILDAMDAAIETIKPGVAAAEVDTVSRTIIAQCSFGGQQTSRSGYSIGIAFPPDWGEGGMLSLQPGERRELVPNMVFHLLPWAIVPGKWAMGFSETVRVTESGCEVLTNYERRLTIK